MLKLHDIIICCIWAANNIEQSKDSARHILSVMLEIISGNTDQNMVVENWISVLPSFSNAVLPIIIENMLVLCSNRLVHYNMYYTHNGYF